MRRLPVLFLVIPLMVALMAANAWLDRWRQEILPRDNAPRTAISLALEALGELRTFMAQSLWFKADVYHHIEEEQGVPWTQERDLMALYKIITLLDPRLVEAYDVGSYQLVMNFNKPQEGLGFLEEGLSHNPTSFTLWFDKAFLLWQLKRYQDAIGPAQRALGLAAEPAHVEKNPLDYINCVRMLAHLYRGAGDAQREVATLQYWMSLRPQDAYPHVRLKELGMPDRPYTPPPSPR